MQTDDLKAAHDHLYNEKLAAEKSNKNLQISASELGKKLSDGNLQLQDADCYNKKSANENGKDYFFLENKGTLTNYLMPFFRDFLPPFPRLFALHNL